MTAIKTIKPRYARMMKVLARAPHSKLNQMMFDQLVRARRREDWDRIQTILSWGPIRRSTRTEHEAYLSGNDMIEMTLLQRIRAGK